MGDKTTHLIGGMTAGVIVASVSGATNMETALGVMLAAAASMVPDRVQYVVKGRDLPLEGHRGFSHTLMFLIATSIWFRPEFAWFWAAGLLSHYLLDLPSASGEPLFWPIHRDRVALGWWTNNGWQEKTERVLMIALSAMLALSWIM